MNDSELQIQKILYRITYKHGWEFEIIERNLFTRDTLLRITALVKDSRKANNYATLQHVAIIPDLLLLPDNSDMFVPWLFNEIMFVERHEAQEWFKVDGVVFDDPHKKGEK